MPAAPRDDFLQSHQVYSLPDIVYHGNKHNKSLRGVAQPGSAPALGAGSRRFKSSRPDQHDNMPLSCRQFGSRPDSTWLPIHIACTSDLINLLTIHQSDKMRDDTSILPEMSAYTRFFAPLALQAASQGLTYPLVAMVASRGSGGPLNLAGLAQSNTLMYMLGTFGFGLVTAGMVFGRTRQGYRQFWAVTLSIGLLVTLVQGLLCVPQAAHLLFGRLIDLPPSIEHPAAMTLLATVPLQFLFFIRIPFQVTMYNARATGKASLATILRILLTAILSPLFCLADAVGPLWAVVCLTFPVGLEVVASACLAKPYLARLEISAIVPSKKEIFWFNLPLSIGGFLLSLSSILLGAFIARAAGPERMLPAYYLALGLATPVAYGATRVLEVVLAFPPAFEGNHRTFRFALTSGLALSLLPLIFILPGLSEVYYVRLQNLDPVNLPLVRNAALALALYPVCVAIRAQGEGLAGLARKPMAIVAGQAVFMITIMSSGSLLLSLGLGGNLIGGISLCFSSLTSTAALRLLLRMTMRPGRIKDALEKSVNQFNSIPPDVHPSGGK